MQANFSTDLLKQLQTLTPAAREQLIAEATIAVTQARNAKQFIDPDPVRWIQTHFYIPELKAPVVLYPVQIAALKEAFTTDENGLFNYSTIVWAAIKKSAKSTIAAAVGLWFAFQRDWSTVKVIANDIKQAESRVAYYMRRAIQLHPEWSKSVKVNNYKITLPNHSTIEAIPIDPGGEAGGNDDLLIFSEIWAWKNKAALKMWTEATLSPVKFGKSLRWIETYAGFTGESPILEQLYDMSVKPELCIDTQHELYANRDARLFTLWNTRPSVPFQTADYYKQEEAILDPKEYKRVHGNEWVTSVDTFIQSEWWETCKGTLPERESSEQMAIALDAGVSEDSFGLVGVTRRGNQLYPRVTREWRPVNGKIDYAQVRATLRSLAQQFPVVCVTYDPYQLHWFAEEMQQELAIWFEQFNQGVERLKADTALKKHIMERRITHDGSDPLNAHVLNANAKVDTENDNKLRIVKRATTLKIDCAVCLSMACAVALRLDIG